ncbi:MAG: hypothetical protein K6G26_06285, partial [Lachnospiraceae bacterium]|nr:hypothetical protein [Lachnospiraceae bacterium]
MRIRKISMILFTSLVIISCSMNDSNKENLGKNVSANDNKTISTQSPNNNDITEKYSDVLKNIHDEDYTFINSDSSIEVLNFYNFLIEDYKKCSLTFYTSQNSECVEYNKTYN